MKFLQQRILLMVIVAAMLAGCGTSGSDTAEQSPTEAPTATVGAAAQVSAEPTATIPLAEPDEATPEIEAPRAEPTSPPAVAEEPTPTVAQVSPEPAAAKARLIFFTADG